MLQVTFNVFTISPILKLVIIKLAIIHKIVLFITKSIFGKLKCKINLNQQE